MSQRTNILLQIEGCSGARLNKVYHLQWGYRKYMPMAFLHLISAKYFQPEKKDVFDFFPKQLNLEGIDLLDRDYGKYDFNKLEDCQELLNHSDNNNGAMVVIITEGDRDFDHPSFKIGFLLGPEDVEYEAAFSRWVTTEEFMQHQPCYDEKYDDIFAHAFDAITTLSGTYHVVKQFS